MNFVRKTLLNQSIRSALLLAMGCASLCATLCAFPVSARSQSRPESVTFPNGLRLISNTRGSFPLVAIDLWIRAGAREEKPGENGTAHFLEHAVFKGTTKRPDNGSDIAIENIGGVINAATGPDYVRFYATVPSKNLEEALEIFSDLMQNSLLSDAQIEKERGVVLDELSLRDADPQNALISRLYEKSFRGHPYFHAPGGEAAQMRIRARDTLAKFYLRFYSPERATIVISGDCSPESAKAAVGRSFGNWKSSSPPGEKQAFSQDVKEFVSGRSLMQGESERGGIGIGFPAPPARDGVACRSAEIVAAILGDSETGGRLATASLKSGIVRAQFTPRLDGSLLTITAIPKVTQNSDGTERKGSQEAREIAVGQLETSVLAVLKSLRENPPRLPEIQAAKQRILGRLIFSQETNAGIAFALGYSAIIGGDTPDETRKRLSAISEKEIETFLSVYFPPELQISVLLRPKEAQR